jgi:hypothetical protein
MLLQSLNPRLEITGASFQFFFIDIAADAIKGLWNFDTCGPAFVPFPPVMHSSRPARGEEDDHSNSVSLRDSIPQTRLTGPEKFAAGTTYLK